MTVDEKEAWLLQRDVTHALVLPVLEIFRQASVVAKSMLGNRNIFDLELAFRGEARGAFSWLQCFIMEEEDWCLTRGCPGRRTIRLETKSMSLTSHSLHREQSP